MRKKIDLKNKILDFNPHTGELFLLREERYKKARAVPIKAYGNHGGYSKVIIGGKRYLQHRLIWYLYYKKEPPDYIDHINGDKNDNRIQNLRRVTCAENIQNQIKPTKRSKSGFLGVSKHRKKWRACICVNRKQINLGVYTTKKEASDVYQVYKKKLHT